MRKISIIIITIILIGGIIFLKDLVTSNIINSINSQKNTSNTTPTENETKSNVIEIDKDSFTSLVSENDNLVIVDFYADWCEPCKLLAPIIDEVSQEYKDVTFCRVNTDLEENLATQNRIMYLPTLIVYKDGQEFSRSTGLISKDDLISLITASY